MIERLATSLLVGALGVTTMTLAWPLTQYGLAKTSADPRAASAELRRLAMKPVTSVPARRDLLAAFRGAPSQAAADAAALVGQAPLTSAAWLTLARARLAVGAPLPKVAGAYLMSQITAPNEPLIMGARAAFALPLWGGFPSDARRAVIVDLTRGGWRQMSAEQRVALRLAAGVAPESVREALRRALEGAQADGLVNELRVAPSAR